MKTKAKLSSALLGVLLWAPVAGLAQFTQGQSFSEESPLRIS